ncbi:MAG TPA: hypothetical protein VF541_18105 [Longimicrobium sp.]
MKKTLIAAVLLLAPAALAAQPAVPNPVRDTVPPHVALPTPPNIPVVPTGNQPPHDVVASAGEGAVTGAVIGAVVALESPDCAPAASPGGSAAMGAGVGALWGGLRGLLGLRRHPIPTVLAQGPVRAEPSRTGPQPPVVDGRCLANTPGAPATAQ